MKHVYRTISIKKRSNKYECYERNGTHDNGKRIDAQNGKLDGVHPDDVDAGDADDAQKRDQYESGPGVGQAQEMK